jgi:ParB family transcriptional regulator, chromosome partitioning protein
MAVKKTPQKPPRRLGRGLDALFNATPSDKEESDALREIPIDEIRSNPFQPRQDFNVEELKELQESLKTSGLLQPITVRRRPDGSVGYELVAGERRLRAAANLGWTTITAVVRVFDDRQLLGLALVENLQRSNLNPMEEAEGYDRLISEFGHSQQSVAELVGKDRSTVANALRILQLPIAIRQMVRDGLLAAGHARPLLGLQDELQMLALAQEIAKKGLTARDIEQRVRQAPQAAQTSKPKRGRPSRVDYRSPEVRGLEQGLRKHLQTDVSILADAKEQGTIKVSFYSGEDLERIAELMGITIDPQ